MTPPGADPNGDPTTDEERAADQRTVELIATVSHEIRSPLTTIKGFTKTMLDRWDRLSDDTKLEMLRAINLDADRVTRILTELLDVSRLEAGRMTMHLRPVLVQELAADLVAVLANRSTEHQLQVIPGDDALEVLADGDKLRQVLTNLIENAQKYADPGVVSISCRKGDDGDAVIEIHDGGPGVPPDLADKIFDKFSRRELPGSPSGTGLGLYISRGLVRAQGGELGARFESAGTTFWIRLPVAP